MFNIERKQKSDKIINLARSIRKHKSTVRNNSGETNRKTLKTLDCSYINSRNVKRR